MQNKYDVIIIGAGIGGIICGIYLAKSGLKVLIVEQHIKPGGYCTSFERKNYRFDAGVHYIGSLKKGVLNQIFKELYLSEKIPTIQIESPDKIIFPDNILYIKSNADDTKMEFKKNFPHEKESIDSFFEFISQNNFFKIYSKIKNLYFDQLLEEFFQGERLKSSIGFLLRNLSISPDKIPALNAIIFLREFALDPGYYPDGGMQSFSNSLVAYFKALSGEIIFNNRVTKITTEDDEVKSILTDQRHEIFSKTIVSNIAPEQTFKALLDINVPELKMIENFEPTSSMFVLYLGIKEDLNPFLKEKSEIWFFPDYQVTKRIPPSPDELLKSDKLELQISFPSLHDKSALRSTMQIYTFSSFENKEFWDINKKKISHNVLSNAYNALPSLKDLTIDLNISATPVTFLNYTANTRGACFGWLPKILPNSKSYLGNRTSIKGLFSCGHWCNNGTDTGVSGVALSGRKCAEIILKKFNKRWPYGLIKL